MNAQIRNLFLIVVVLFAVLVAFSSRWTVFEDGDLRADTQNTRNLIRAQRVPRGRILAADGTTLARSVRVRSQDNNEKRYRRAYPQGSAFAAPVGYSSFQIGETGLERSQQENLAGKAQKLATAVDRLIQGDQRGDNVETTLEPKVQRAAIAGLNGRPGAVVALEPATGKVLAMVSTPSFNPNQLVGPNGAKYSDRLNKAETTRPLVNRATQAAEVPGSTFKVVTAAAALDSGKFTPDTLIDGSNGQTFSSVPLNNFGGEDPGQVTLTDALTNSINTAFANVAVTLGKSTMQKYMKRFGFGEQPPLDYPSDQRRASGLFRNGRFLPATSRFVDIARAGIGQSILQVTPLQMAMVSATVANGGRLMTPHLVDRVVDADGRVQETVKPKLFSRVMSEESAGQLRTMMGKVVEEGTGTASALSGIQVGGKTGTAELNIAKGLNDLWFMGFAPLNDPKVAVAVVLENTQGAGGTVAAPVAKQVLQAALGQGGTSR